MPFASSRCTLPSARNSSPGLWPAFVYESRPDAGVERGDEGGHVALGRRLHEQAARDLRADAGRSCGRPRSGPSAARRTRPPAARRPSPCPTRRRSRSPARRCRRGPGTRRSRRRPRARRRWRRTPSSPGISGSCSGSSASWIWRASAISFSSSRRRAPSSASVRLRRRSAATEPSAASSSMSCSEKRRTCTRELSTIMPWRARGVDERRRDQAAHARAQDALGRREALVGLRVEHQRHLALLGHLVLEAAREEEVAARARQPAAGDALEPAVRPAQEDHRLLGPEVDEGAVEHGLEQLLERERGGERPVDLVQHLEAARRLALGGREQLRGRAQHDRVGRARLRRRRRSWAWTRWRRSPRSRSPSRTA